MGDVPTAKKLLETTNKFARKRKILIGISEGAAELAKIHLNEGNYSKAEKLAEEAYLAALKCNCSPNNTSRALVVRAKIALNKFKLKETKNSCLLYTSPSPRD